jgi:hypothetical protein
MVVFLTLCALVVIVLYRQIWAAFSPIGLNALIIAVARHWHRFHLPAGPSVPEIDWSTASVADRTRGRTSAVLLAHGRAAAGSHRPHGDFLAGGASSIDRSPAGRARDMSRPACSCFSDCWARSGA